MAKFLITLGIILVIIGLLWPYLSQLGLGRLPGDIIIKKQNFTFYFPLTTCILISIIIAIVLWFISK